MYFPRMLVVHLFMSLCTDHIHAQSARSADQQQVDAYLARSKTMLDRLTAYLGQTIADPSSRDMYNDQISTVGQSLEMMGEAVSADGYQGGGCIRGAVTQCIRRRKAAHKRNFGRYIQKMQDENGIPKQYWSAVDFKFDAFGWIPNPYDVSKGVYDELVKAQKELVQAAKTRDPIQQGILASYYATAVDQGKNAVTFYSQCTRNLAEASRKSRETIDKMNQVNTAEKILTYIGLATLALPIVSGITSVVVRVASMIPRLALPLARLAEGAAAIARTIPQAMSRTAVVGIEAVNAATFVPFGDTARARVQKPNLKGLDLSPDPKILSTLPPAVQQAIQQSETLQKARSGAVVATLKDPDGDTMELVKDGDSYAYRHKDGSLGWYDEKGNYQRMLPNGVTKTYSLNNKNAQWSSTPQEGAKLSYGNDGAIITTYADGTHAIRYPGQLTKWYSKQGKLLQTGGGKPPVHLQTEDQRLDPQGQQAGTVLYQYTDRDGKDMSGTKMIADGKSGYYFQYPDGTKAIPLPNGEFRYIDPASSVTAQQACRGSQFCVKACQGKTGDTAKQCASAIFQQFQRQQDDIQHECRSSPSCMKICQGKKDQNLKTCAQKVFEYYQQQASRKLQQAKSSQAAGPSVSQECRYSPSCIKACQGKSGQDLKRCTQQVLGHFQQQTKLVKSYCKGDAKCNLDISQCIQKDEISFEACRKRRDDYLAKSRLAPIAQGLSVDKACKYSASCVKACQGKSGDQLMQCVANVFGSFQNTALNVKGYCKNDNKCTSDMGTCIIKDHQSFEACKRRREEWLQKHGNKK